MLCKIAIFIHYTILMVRIHVVDNKKIIISKLCGSTEDNFAFLLWSIDLRLLRMVLELFTTTNHSLTVEHRIFGVNSVPHITPLVSHFECRSFFSKTYFLRFGKEWGSEIQIDVDFQIKPQMRWTVVRYSSSITVVTKHFIKKSAISQFILQQY